MKTTYNGKKDRKTIQDFFRLCKVCEENREEIMKYFNENGPLCVTTDFCPITGCPDELSERTPLKTEVEINDFLKKDFKRRFEGYLRYKKNSDPLTAELYSFIKENMRFPTADEMKIIEKTAEDKRLEGATDETKEISMAKLIKKEIIQLAIEIYFLTDLKDPKSIHHRVEPYDSSLPIENENIAVTITYNRWYPNDRDSDYNIHACRNDKLYFSSGIHFWSGYDNDAYMMNSSYENVTITEENREFIIAIHEYLSKIAREKGFEFTSEVDYEKIIEE